MTSGFELFTSQSLKFIIKKGIHSKGPFFQSEIRKHAHSLNYGIVPIKYSASSRKINSKELVDALHQLSRLFLDTN